MSIIDLKLIKDATILATPSVEAILKDPRCVWGPKFVSYVIVYDKMCHIDCFGKNTDWNPEWGSGPEFFMEVAQKKAELAHRTRKSTGEVVALSPWELQPGDYTYPGGVYQDGIAIGVSGVESFADELIAKILLACIVALAKLKFEKMLEEGDSKV